MSEQTDFSALEWVKGEISESLRQAQHALEAYVANPNDSTKMQFCITHLHQVWGTLQMVELEGASMFATEMEALAQAILDGSTPKVGEAQEVLMQAFLQLPTYLDNLVSGSKDMPVVLLPMLNDLRSTRGANLMSESVMFNPDLTSGHKVAQQREESKVSDLEDQLQKLRKAYQKSLLLVLKGQELEKNLDYMGKVLARLQKLSGRSQISQIWWIAGAMIDGLLAGSIEFSKSASSLLGAIDRQIKDMVDDSNKVLNNDVSKELAKNLLYYVASSDPATKRIANVQKAYKLSKALPSEVRQEQSQQARRGLVNEAIVAAVGVLIEDLLTINENLDLVVRGKGKEDHRLKDLLPIVKSIAGALHVISLRDSRDIMAAQYKVLAACVAGKVDDVRSELMGVAGQLLAVESNLNDIAKHGMSGKILIGEISNANKVSTEQLGNAQKVLLNEAISTLETVKELFAAILASGWNHEVLEESVTHLKALSGSLKIIPLNMASEVLDKSALYISERLLKLDQAPEQKELENFADVLSSVDYFLEKLRTDSRSDTESLNIGAQQLASLGFALDKDKSSENLSATIVEEAEDGVALSEILETQDDEEVRIKAEEAQQKHAGQIESEDDLADDVQAQAEELVSQPASDEIEEIPALVAEAEPEGAPEAEQVPEPASMEAAETPAQDQDDDDNVIDDEIIEIFIEEVGEVQETLQEFLPKWRENTSDDESLTEVRRAFHTLKGSGRMVGATEIGEMAWSVENMLNRVIDNTIKINEVLLQTVLDAVETVPELLELFKQAKNESTERSREISQRADSIANGEAVNLAAVGTSEASDVASENPQTETAEETVESIEAPEIAENTESLDAPAPVPEYDEEIIEIFSQEALGHTAALKEFTDECRAKVGPWIISDDVLRVMHTLKGCANMAAIEPVAPVVTKAENFVKELRLLDKKANDEVIGLIENVCELTNQVIDELPHVSSNSVAMADANLETIAGLAEKLLQGDAGELEGDSGKQERIDEFLAFAFDLIFDGEDYLNDYSNALDDEQAMQAVQDNLRQLGTECAQIASLANTCELEEIAELSAAIATACLQACETQINDAYVKDLGTGLQRLGEIVDFLAAGQFIKSPAKITAKIQAHIDETPVTVQTDQVEPLAEGAGDTGTEDVDAALPLAELQEPGEDLDDSVAEAESSGAEFEALEQESADQEYTGQEAAEEELSEQDAPPPLAELTESEEEEAVDEAVFTAELEEAGEAQAEITAEFDVAADADTQREAEETESLENNIPEPVTTEASQAAGPVDFSSIENVLDEDIERDDEIVEIFLEEAEEIIEHSANLLEQWQDEPSDLSIVGELQRNLHTLKGGARMAEFAAIGDLGHELENIYEAVASSQLASNGELFGLLFRCHDRISEMFSDIRDKGNCYRADDLLAEIKYFVSGEAPSAPTVSVVDETLEAVASEDFETPSEQAQEETGDSEPTLAEIEATVEPEESVEEINDDAGSDEDDSRSEKLFDEEDDSELDADLELVEIFLEEAEEIIESSATALEEWRSDTGNTRVVEQLQRELHTLKGGARMAQISEIGDFAHEMENIYEGLVNGTVNTSDALLNLLFQCHDRLNEMVTSLKASNACEAADDLVEQLKLALQGKLGEVNDSKAATKAELITLEKGIDASVIETFLADGVDLLKQVEGALLQLQASHDEKDIGQAVETLSAFIEGARLSGLKSLASYCEGFVKQLKEQGTDKAAQQQLMKAFGDIKDFVAQLDKQRTKAKPETKTAAVQKKAEKDKPKASKAVAKQKDAQAESIKISADLLENLVNLAGETSINRGRLEVQLSEFAFTIEEMEGTIERLQEQLRRLHLETEAQIVFRHEKDGPTEEEIAQMEADDDFDPLEMDRYSAIDQLSRSLSESASDLIDLKETLMGKTRDAETLLLQQGRVNTELQEGLMRSRMVPFSRLLPRLRRIVRQVGNELNKPVDLEILNAEGEMDRAVLERMISPIEHMLRNSIAHGIEKADARKKADKPKNGTITIDLGREGSNMVITLKDDGAGVNVEAVRKKAIENGLLDAKANLPDNEIVEFIFNPGFSTAAEVSQVAGRGVGMDVVASEIKELGGSIETHSVTGQGTTFIIRLPFTVAVNRALMVNIGEDYYAIPLTSIEGVVRVSPYELEAYYEEEAPIFNYAGLDYELQYLGSYMHGNKRPHLLGQTRPLPVLLVRSGDYAVAMQVDSLLGSREVVVKSVGPQLSSVAGISGATILGDGSVVIILDIHSMIRGAIAQKTSVSIQNDVMESRKQDRPTQVMVVDDSVTVRKVTSRLLERNGMEVILAKDGVDAITQLQEVKPDVMLLDIEMPRMDGFEVATLVRHDDRLQDVPIIMITSRTGEKHKQRAMDIGVNRYMGKPFQETVLLSTIEELLSEKQGEKV